MSNEGVRALVPLTALTSLDLAGCPRVTIGVVGSISQLSALTSISVSWPPVVAMGTLAGLTALRLNFKPRYVVIGLSR